MGFVTKALIIASLLWGGAGRICGLGADSAFAKDTQAAAKIAKTYTAKTYTKGERAGVARVIDGDSFVLEDGLRVSLAGIQTPKMAWPEKNYKAWPLSDEAKSYLNQLIKDKTVQLYYTGDTRDRYGRALAQVWTLDAQGAPVMWLQEAMVKAGYARIYTWPSHPYDTTKLYAAEHEARQAGRGIWRDTHTDGFYSVRTSEPKPLARHVDSLQIVEGIIVSTADVRGTIYLNFGSDYKIDFTVAISKKSKRAFKKASYDPLALTGARVRVRGWIELRNGPIIWINDPRRLEVLD
ncbi:MAG: nuclease (SNase) [Robiginitomaculum sp.]|nr:MAG: nuclease (SNase) [Robiginitomaculum sp.]